ncbi:TPA: hypothetical protein HA242_00860 [Candidatus Woesearchaeota archaeon]|nr:hypothetical protein [Candidatus Woesearchaeota archaeon]HIG93609.1 hypothetical protein [Candidatus Woesearchaeota archaeon]HIH12249.1 hypothetical protein [Candidatus Woesearchaeota archaeon]
MIELEAFLRGQQQVYDKFRAARDAIRAEGTTPPKTVENRDGYLVIMKHPEEIVERSTALSRRIAAIVPAMTYEGIAVHTTIGVVGMQYRSPEQQGVDRNAVALLEDALNVASRDFAALTIPYERWLYNRDTTIAQGIAGKAFVHLADLVHESLQKHNAAERIGKVQQPWGGHITISRFLEHTPAAQLQDFFNVVEAEPSLPPSTPEAVCLGYVSVKNGVVGIEILEKFELKHD